MAEQDNTVASSEDRNDSTSEATPPDSLNEERDTVSIGEFHSLDNESMFSTNDQMTALNGDSNRTTDNEQNSEQDDPKPQNISSSPNSAESAEETPEAPAINEQADTSLKKSDLEVTLVLEDANSVPEGQLVSFCENTETTNDALVDTNLMNEDDTSDKSKVVLSSPQIIGMTYQMANGGNLDPPLNHTPVAMPKPKKERPYFNPGPDSKIAQELEEMRAREEELLRMRENLLKSNVSNSSSQMSDSGVSVHSEEGQSIVEQTSPVHHVSEENQDGFVNRQLDNLETQNAYNLGYAFGHRRKDNVKVKPLADDFEDAGEEEDRKPYFSVLNESPIEREIRLNREREEELRKEKRLSGVSLGEQQQQQQRPSSLLLNGSDSSNGLSNGSTRTPVKDTQRFLATSRIQQEIDEQTEREIALRASGKIQTISQERTDEKVTKLRDVSSLVEKRVLQTPTSPPTSLVTSSSSTSDSEKTTPVVNSNGSTNGHHFKTPSPASSLSGGQIGHSTHNGSSGGGRRFSNPPQVRGVSMQRFIASKGRELTFSAFGSSSQKSNSVLSLHSDSYRGTREGSRPLISPGSLQAVNRVPGVKRCVPAETKIQEELKEMTVREDELRKQRARLLGLSQPNLSTLTGDDDLEVNNGHHQDNSSQGSNMDRAASNPNLLDDEQYEDEDEKISVGGPRRRSMLIDQWEKRIQKSEEVKAT